MLSVENRSDPSSSSRVSGIKNNERGCEKLAFQEQPDLAIFHLDDHTHLPKFSIRDYVISARTNDIEKNWPFQQKYLQICLQHSIKDILPPFEPPDFLRTRCCAKNIGCNRLLAIFDGEKAIKAVNSIESKRICSLDIETNYIKDESSPQIDGSSLGSSNGNQFPFCNVSDEGFGKKDEKYHRNSSKSLCSIENTTGQEAEFAAMVTTVTSCDWMEGEVSTEQNLPSSLLETKGTPEASLEQSGKGPYLIENLELISESGRTEEIVLNSSSLLEPMTSKVCPVCKAFASPSNTTLNAHIDQCLEVDSSSKLATANQTRRRVKPRKKKSMVDIYANAPCCTLEELDWRNGTNWAENSSCLLSNGDFCKEAKRRRVSPVSIMGEDDTNAVYVDSNGTKVGILSKLGNDSKPTMREDVKRKKYLNRKNRKISSSGCNRRCLAPRNSKDLKVKYYSKKLSSLEPQKNEILEVLEEVSFTHGEGRKESLSQLGKDEDGILRQCLCSKQSVLSKQSFTNGIKDVIFPKQHSWFKFKNNQLKEGNSSREENHILKIPRSLGNSDSFLGFKKLASQVSTKQKTDYGRKVSRTPSTYDASILRFAKPSRHYVSSARSKQVEMHTSADQNSDNIPKKLSENHCHPAETNRLSTLRKNTLLDGSDFPRKKMKSNGNKERLIFRKPQKELPGSKTREFVGEMPSKAVEEHDCVPVSNYSFMPKSKSLNMMNETHKFNSPKIMVLASSNEMGMGDPVVKQNKSSVDSAHIDEFDIQDCTPPVYRSETLVESEIRSISNQETLPEEITNVFSDEKDQREAAISAREWKFLSGIDKLEADSSPNHQRLETSFSSQGDMDFDVVQDDPSSIGNAATVSPKSTAGSGWLTFEQNERKQHFDKEPSRSPEGISSSGPSGLFSDTSSSRSGSTKFISDYELSPGMMVADDSRKTRLGQDESKFGSIGRQKEPSRDVSDNQIYYSCKEDVCQETMPLSTRMTVAKMLEKPWHDPSIDGMVISGMVDPTSMKEKSGCSAMKFPMPGVLNFATGPAQSQAPPSPNQILRLMGKNLMVVSKDEEDSNQLGGGFSRGGSSSHPNTKYLTLLGVLDENRDRLSFCLDDGSRICVPNPLQNFVGVSENHSSDPRRIYEPGTDPVHHCKGGLTASSAGLNGRCSNAQTQQIKTNKKTNSAFVFDAERGASHPHQEDQIPASVARYVQDVIVIDNSPVELEVDSGTIYTGSRIDQSPLVGNASTISISSLKKPAQTFPSQSSFMSNDPPADLGLKFLMSCPGANIDFGKRGSNWEGPGVLPNPYRLPSLSTVRMN